MAVSKRASASSLRFADSIANPFLKASASGESGIAEFSMEQGCLIYISKLWTKHEHHPRASYRCGACLGWLDYPCGHEAGDSHILSNHDAKSSLTTPDSHGGSTDGKAPSGALCRHTGQSCEAAGSIRLLFSR